MCTTAARSPKGYKSRLQVSRQAQAQCNAHSKFCSSSAQGYKPLSRCDKATCACWQALQPAGVLDTRRLACVEGRRRHSGVRPPNVLRRMGSWAGPATQSGARRPPWLRPASIVISTASQAIQGPGSRARAGGRGRQRCTAWPNRRGRCGAAVRVSTRCATTHARVPTNEGLEIIPRARGLGPGNWRRPEGGARFGEWLLPCIPRGFATPTQFCQVSAVDAVSANPRRGLWVAHLPRPRDAGCSGRCGRRLCEAARRAGGSHAPGLATRERNANVRGGAWLSIVVIVMK